MVEKRGTQEAPAKVSVSSKKLLAASINKKIDYYLSKTTFDELDLYYLVKDFFREFLELKYEFSLEELKKELDKVFLEKSNTDSILAFIDKIKTIEYETTTFEAETLTKMMKEFSLIVDTLTSYVATKKKKGFFSSLFGKKEKQVFDEKVPLAPVIEKKSVKEEKQEVEEPMFEDIPEEEPPVKKAPAKKKESPPEEKIKYEVPEVEDENYSWVSDAKKAKEKKSEESFAEPPKQDKKEIDILIEQSKNTDSKAKLVDIYKGVNELYEKESPESKSRYYPEIIKIYEKIAKAK